MSASKAAGPLSEQDKQRLHRLLRRGTQLLQDGQTSKAVRLLERAREIDPTHLDVALNLSSAFILTKKFKQAVPLLEELAERHSPNAMIWVNLGAAYLGNPVLAREAEQARAIEAFKQAFAIDPHTPHVAYNLGLIYRDQKDYDTAVSWFQAAIEANPQDRDAHLMLARMQALAAEEE